MIQPTAKAASLPSDLKSAWAELMGEKFPMTVDEAMVYTLKKWRDQLPGQVSVRQYTSEDGEHGILVDYQYERQIQQAKQSFPTDNQYQNLLQQLQNNNVFSGYGSKVVQEQMKSRNSYFEDTLNIANNSPQFNFEQVYLVDLRPSVIDERMQKLKDIKA